MPKSIHKLHVFIDEAGDTTFFGKGKENIVGQIGVSSTFMLGMVQIKDDLENLRQKIKQKALEIENSSHINYTCTYFSDHKDIFSHDRVTRFLANSSLDPKTIFHKTSQLITFSPNGYLIFDDSVIDKNTSSKIEMVRKQRSGNKHKVIKGIGLIGCVYYNPDINEFWLLDYRLYDIETDQKKKPDHMLDMLDEFEKFNILYQTILCDAAHSTVKLFNKL